MGYRTSLKIHFFHFHLNVFASNLRAVGDEHGQLFYQDIMKIKNRYKSKLNHSIMDATARYPGAKYTISAKNSLRNVYFMYTECDG